MKKLLFLLLTLTFYIASAGPVGKDKALLVASNYLSKMKGKTHVEIKAFYPIDYKGEIMMYAAQADSGGFVLVSADDNVRPVLAYSTKGSFPYPVESPEVRWWLEQYAAQIEYASESGDADPKAKTLWKQYEEGNIAVAKATVGPLVQSTWNQTGGGAIPYNYYCPPNTPVGCVSTATSQVMRYWEFPDHGNGWYGYEEDNYGFLSVNLEQKSFDWANMPLDGSNYDVARLCYQVGVTLRMDYSPSGSGSYTFNLVYILPNLWNYSQDIMYYSRTYIGASWEDTLRRQIDLGQPVVYSGYGDDGGHAFVCDGYDDNDQFHFNWGWGGSYDGWYSVSALTPGSYNFTDDQAAVINIKPAAAPTRMPIAAQANISSGSYFKIIKAGDQSVALAVTSDGKTMKTTTGGMTWKPVNMPYSLNYDCIDVINTDTAIVVFSGMALYTRDGGENWNDMSIPADVTPKAIMFNPLRSAQGYFFGVDGTNLTIYYTEDFGQTWTDKGSLTLNSGEDLLPMSISSTSALYLMTDRARLISFDGTSLNVSTIENVSEDVNVLYAIASNKNGFAIVKSSTGETYYSTTDGGQTWASIAPSGNVYSKDLKYKQDDDIFVSLSDDGSLSYSEDYGTTWLDFPQYYDYYSIQTIEFAPGGYGYLSKKEKVYSPGSWFWGTSFTAEAEKVAEIQRNCINNDLTFRLSVKGEVDSIIWNFGSDAQTPVVSGTTVELMRFSQGGDHTVSATAYAPDGYDRVFWEFYLDDEAPAPIDTIEGKTMVKLDEQVQYSVNDLGDVTYKWILPAGWSWATSDRESNQVSVIAKAPLGPTQLSVSAENGCGSNEPYLLPITVVTGNAQVAYPNPTTDMITVEQAQGAKLYLYNNTGRLIKTAQSSDYMYKLDVSDLPAGIYLLKVDRPEQEEPFVAKIIVNH